MKFIVTHPGSAHKDEFLACCLLVANAEVPIFRREPDEADLEDYEVAVVDVGHRHEPELLNFDHHQFPRDHPPICSLSLVLQDMGLYEDARRFCEWLEPAEYFDTRGGMGTARWLGVDPKVIRQLDSPIDGVLLNQFSKCTELKPGELMWDLMQTIGSSMISFIERIRQRLEWMRNNAKILEIEERKAIYLPKADPPFDDPSFGIGYFVDEIGYEIAGLIYPDRRGSGFGLTRNDDYQGLDFTRIKDEADVHFAHARGFVAKSSATDLDRLQKLFAKSLK